jgi:endonuclease I/chitodextrinase
MKSKLLFLLLLASLFAGAQIPAAYYNTATGKNYTLKTQLHTVIKNHTDLGYDGLWTTYNTSDRDTQYDNDNSIMDIYSENPIEKDPYIYSYGTNQCGTYKEEGQCYNREHVIPQSIFIEASPMKNDAFFIAPTDGKVNAQRSNYPHAMVASPTWTSLNGSKFGASTTPGYEGIAFEPIDEFKGDIARMYFYFATRYQDVINTWGVSYAMFDGSTDKVFTPAFLDMLIYWHNQDPVSPYEKLRNEAIYARQKNRNPFIDHPEYVAQIWATITPDTQTPTTVPNFTVTTTTSNTATLTWQAATDNIGVTQYDVYVNSILKSSVTKLSTTITALTPNTTYDFYIIAKDALGNSSPISTVIKGTTTTPVSDTQPPTVATNLTITNTTSNTITLNWTASTDNVAVTFYDIYINTALKTSVTGTTVTIPSLLPTTTYPCYVIARDAAGNLSSPSTTINATTTATNNGAKELFFSEYIEGSGTNKALEIANFTGSAVNLSAYSIKKQSNGAGVWGAALNLAGTLNSENTFVIVNASIGLICYNKTAANISTTADALQFNGNDPIGLFKNGELIDIIGTFNGGSADFAIDQTLIRKSSILIPNSNFYKAAEWDVLTKDNCTNLGIHKTNTLSKPTFESSTFSITPNPSNGTINILFEESDGPCDVVIFSLQGQKVFEKNNILKSTLSIPSLQSGLYLVRLTKGSKSTTKKLIIK